MTDRKSKSERQPPQLPTRNEIQAAVANLFGALAPPSPNWVSRALRTLRAIRDGAEASYVEVDDVRLLERVTYDEDGNLYYHLSLRARELLRANGGLPWGR